jgi:hypothetical protein
MPSGPVAVSSGARPGSASSVMWQPRLMRVGLDVADAQRRSGFLLRGEAEQRLAGLDTGHLGAAAGQHPAQVAVAAAGVQDPLPGQVPEHPQQDRVEQVALGEVAVAGRLLQQRTRHRPPLRDSPVVGPLRRHGRLRSAHRP